MIKFSVFFCVAALAVFSTVAFADDPALALDGVSGICSPTPELWCSSEQQATDSSTGLTTVEYTFSSQVVPDISTDWSGWVEGTIGGEEAALLHFVTGGTVLSPTYSVFLYCGGYSPGICTANNDVLPVSENPSATFNMSPSFGGEYSPDSSGGSGTLPGSGQYGPGTPIGYTIGYTTTGLVGTTVSEPPGVLLLGTMMVGVVCLVGVKFSARVS
jgi:hypothetical protein